MNITKLFALKRFFNQQQKMDKQDNAILSHDF